MIPIPIRHENTTVRRLPFITIGLIVLNILVFLFTHGTMEEEAPKLGQLKADILILAAAHPELKISGDTQQMVESFRVHNPQQWAKLQDPQHDIIDAFDAHLRMTDESAEPLQQEMDSFSSSYVQLESSTIAEQYALIPSHPRALAYITSQFLHGGWLHLLGNMWFLWLAGFVLEDRWGRAIYAIFYLVGGIAAAQFYIWTNPGSLVPTIGASGAVAALMGAFLARFPKIKIEMAVIYGLGRMWRFSAPAYWLLPVWLLGEIFYGALYGSMSAVAHWAHVGGFVFGALAALALAKSGLEHTVNQAIAQKTGHTTPPEIESASNLLEHGKLDEVLSLLVPYLTAHRDSVDALMILRETYWRRGQTADYQDASLQMCAIHLKKREWELAWHCYEDYLKEGGELAKLPPSVWLDLCRAAEEQQALDQALEMYQKLVATYPSERQALMAQLNAAKLCLKRLNRPQDALKLYEAASNSLIPHLDLDAQIQIGIRSAQAALTPGS